MQNKTIAVVLIFMSISNIFSAGSVSLKSAGEGVTVIVHRSSFLQIYLSANMRKTQNLCCPEVEGGFSFIVLLDIKGYDVVIIHIVVVR
jgi:hypothetical protein